MANFYAYVLAHSGVIIEALSTIVVIDHTLAASSLFKSNSTAQAIFAGISKAGGWILSVFKGGSQPS